jgi:flagellar basal body L-ring protein FlgH
MWSNARKGLPAGVAVSLAVLAMAGCSSVRDAAGISKAPPDEFAVVNKAPLIIPPDFNLKPPKPGAAPLNQVSPTITAEAALYSNEDPSAVANTITGNFSESEKMLLAQAGAVNSDNSIRQQIAADNRNMQSADENFTDQLLFGSGSTNNSDAPLNADAEKARIDASKDAKPSETPAPEIKKDSGSWLDGIF